jgi:hypothetical protein
MRAFRVIRLFGRLGSLRDIIAALTAAVIPVQQPGTHPYNRDRVPCTGSDWRVT